MNEESTENADRRDKFLKKIKQFTKTTWFPLTVAVAVVVLAVGVVLVLLLFGWRITYAPGLENNWDAVSGVAAWVSILVSIASVGASLAAVWAAIQIPNKIAERQDRIALINSRLEIADKIEDISESIWLIYNLKNDVFDLDKDALSRALSFATSAKYIKNRNIIRKYSLYFSEFHECEKRWLALYRSIVLIQSDLEYTEDRNTVIKELMESIGEANKFVDSEDFKQWKIYMREATSIM